ncbi:MAG: sigma-54-dependent Fis family transcriptional regulator [Desulfarculus sp.]|nr:sigma-54-dependent Fis family transcriptional regulator [Desulfarculus sp.]
MTSTKSPSTWIICCIPWRWPWKRPPCTRPSTPCAASSPTSTAWRTSWPPARPCSRCWSRSAAWPPPTSPFGHEKGAFTGAHKYRTGRFEQAHGGSLFLDEVGDMSPATQSKVLRAIEDKEVQRVGGSRTIRVDVRIIAATNVDLQRAVQEGRFRGDLFYRLSITPICIPPLRQRPEDILPLAEMFLWRICQDSKRPPKPMSPAANQALAAHSWPGNIRELRNVIERAVLFANGPEITPQDLGLGGPAPRQASASPAQGPGLPAPGTLDLEALEHWAILTALERSDWVQSRAAGLLGISPRALSYKLDKLELVHPELGERRRRR